MKIGFDGKRAANNLTGLGNYSRSLITHLASIFPQNQYFVYTPKVKDKPQIASFLQDKRIKIRKPQKAGLLWRTWGIKKQLLNDQIDLFHGLSHEIPIGLDQTPIASLVTIHDLIFLKFPKYFGIIDRLIYKMKSRYACRRADRIIAISECTKRDIVHFYGIASEKIDVVYQSCDDSFKVTPNADFNLTVKNKFALPSKYILNVGTIETRKNLATLIRALEFINPEYKLVVVGKQTDYINLVKKDIDRLQLTNRVIFLQNVPFSDLPSIYQMADVFVYPSLYEGFGIPIIEALYCEVPVVAATGSCLEEAGGPDSLYVPALDAMALSLAINRIINDPNLQMEMKTRGRAYVKRFDNEVVTNHIMNVYKRTLSAKNN